MLKITGQGHKVVKLSMISGLCSGFKNTQKSMR